MLASSQTYSQTNPVNRSTLSVVSDSNTRQKLSRSIIASKSDSTDNVQQQIVLLK